MMRLFILLALLCAACAGQPPTVTLAPTEAPFYAPDFTAETLDGGTTRLSDQRGRWVVLNFWATWCAPCVAEMPVLQQVADDYPETVTLLGVNMREERAAVADFIEAHAIRYLILINPGDQMLLDYAVMGLPQTLIIDPAGEVVYRSFGEVTLDSFEALLDSFIGV
jgi:thiol-disulfide isomerase/thioredoxin